MSYLKRSGIQLAEPYSEKRLLNLGRYRSTWRPPYVLQPKLDGERCRAIVSGGRCLLLSSTEEIISSVPHINDAMLRYPYAEYDGELYIHGWNQSQTHSIVSRTTNLHPEYSRMQYHIFDIKNENIQAERISQVHALPTNSCIKTVRASIAHTPSEIMALYDQYISDGYEGFIIRELTSYYVEKRSQLMMKFKPKAFDTYKIINIIEAVSDKGESLNMIGAFECTDDMGSIFRVGAGKISHKERKHLWEHHCDTKGANIGKLLEIEYQTLTSKNKVPQFSRALQILQS